MLAEENKNAGTSALEGKDELQGLIALSPAPSSVAAMSLDQKRRKKEKRGALGFEMRVSLS